MARFEFRLPDIGEGVTEGEIVRWGVKPGDTVKEDQELLEVMTDKATVSITSPVAGRVQEVHGKVGEVVQIHALLVVFDVDGAAPAAQVLPAHATHAATEDAKASAAKSVQHAAGGQPTRENADASTYFNEKPLATPATRRAARELGLEISRIPPTGPQGRVTRDDVVAFSEKKGGPSSALTSASSAPSQTAAAPPAAAGLKAAAIAPLGGAQGQALEERVPFAGMRRKISQKMAQSKHTAAHFTFVEECDVGALKHLRERLKPKAAAASVKLTFLPFIVKAVVASLKKHPVLNSALDETTSELVYRKVYNIGIATSTDAGLMVPVIKDADRRSILDIAREIERLGNDAKVGKSKLDDLSGSTFTITSLGAQGGLFATPILNFPEVGILGIHQIKEKPVVRDGAIVIGEVMLLSLSFDHRIVDGHIGAAFAYDVIGYLQDPEKLMLEMS
jgi:pyruvate dehydrogenase E2 component (dihydrolipoamide acetyltransferase)